MFWIYSSYFSIWRNIEMLVSGEISFYLEKRCKKEWFFWMLSNWLWEEKFWDKKEKVKRPKMGNFTISQFMFCFHKKEWANHWNRIQYAQNWILPIIQKAPRFFTTVSNTFRLTLRNLLILSKLIWNEFFCCFVNYWKLSQNQLFFD